MKKFRKAPPTDPQILRLRGIIADQEIENDDLRCEVAYLRAMSRELNRQLHGVAVPDARRFENIEQAIDQSYMAGFVPSRP